MWGAPQECFHQVLGSTLSLQLWWWPGPGVGDLGGMDKRHDQFGTPVQGVRCVAVELRPAGPGHGLLHGVPAWPCP